MRRLVTILIIFAIFLTFFGVFKTILTTQTEPQKGTMEIPGTSNTNNDTVSKTADPFENIKTMAADAGNSNETGDYASKILSHDIPAHMYEGQELTVTVVVRNEGDVKWNSDRKFGLGQKIFEDGYVKFGKDKKDRWDVNDKEFSSHGGVLRGQPVTFKVDLVAPTYPGHFVTYWQMVYGEKETWFGEQLEVTIAVD